MSWFSRNFGRKEGGSTGGNILRRVSSAVIKKLTLGIYDGSSDNSGGTNNNTFLW